MSFLPPLDFSPLSKCLGSLGTRGNQTFEIDWLGPDFEYGIIQYVLYGCVGCNRDIGGIFCSSKAWLSKNC
jgi:hypothetical protein